MIERVCYGIGANEMVWYSLFAVNSNLLQYYLINFVMNSHFRILDNLS